MAKTTEYVACLLCHYNQVINKKSKGMVDFRNWDPKKSDFIQIRDATGGRTSDGKSHGFPKVGALTLHDAVVANNPDYDEVLKRMREQLLAVLKEFHDEGLVTSADIKAIIP